MLSVLDETADRLNGSDPADRDLTTALTMVRATVTGDADLARTGARAEAAMRIWQAASDRPLNDEGVIELPAFA